MTQGVAGQQGAPEATPGGEAPKGGILGRTAMGAGWMFAWRMTTRILGLVSTLVLVRLLTPEDFGLFGLAFAVIATLETVLATGVDAQLVRARQTSRDLYDTVFTLNVIRGITLALLMLASAAPAAEFFREPRIEAVMQALAVIPLLAGIGNVGVAEFSRNLDFAKVFKLLIVPRLLQIGVTVAAAATFQSYWALIIGAIIGRAIATAFTYVVHPYRPRLTLKLWRELLGISFWTWAISIATAVRDRTGTFVIGRMLGMHDLGVFTMSVELASLPTSEIASPISQATMPGLAASLRSGDTAAVSRAFLRILGSTVTIALPAAIGVSLVAGPLVVLLLGQRWIETAPLIAILGATWVGFSISLIGMALLDAYAKLRRLCVFVLVGAALRGAALIALAPFYGLTGIAVGLGISLLVEATLLTGWCMRLLGLRAACIGKILWRPFAAVGAMAAVLWAVGVAWSPPATGTVAAAIELATAAVLGSVTYASALGLLWSLAGRPEGAEADLLALTKRLLAAAARATPSATRPARHGTVGQ